MCLVLVIGRVDFDADMNVLGLQVHLVYILVYFCAMTLVSILVESGSLVL